MLALNILQHAFLQVVGNLRQLVNISLIPLLIQLVGAAAIVFTIIASGQTLFVSALMIALLLLPFVWIAVNWHRYVLLNEPQPIIPNMPLGAMMRYIGTAILIGILIILPFIAAVLVFQLIAPIAGGGGFLALIFGFALALALMVVSLRLSVALPAAAIDAPNPITTAWRETAGNNGSFLLLSILMILLQLPFNLLEYVPIGPSTPVVVSVFLSLLSIVLLWIYMFISLSVLTTLYGYFIEKRQLRTSI